MKKTLNIFTGIIIFLWFIILAGFVSLMFFSNYFMSIGFIKDFVHKIGLTRNLLESILVVSTIFLIPVTCIVLGLRIRYYKKHKTIDVHVETQEETNEEKPEFTTLGITKFTLRK